MQFTTSNIRKRLTEKGKEKENKTKVNQNFIILVDVDPRRDNPWPGELHEAGDTDRGGGSGDLEEQEGVLQDQVNIKITKIDCKKKKIIHLTKK